jgi:hypothetical protein
LPAGEIPVAGVHALEFAAIHHGQRALKQADLPADDDELRTGCTDCSAIVAAEIGDGFEIRRQTPGQPHQLDIAMAFSLKTPA